MSNVLSFPVGRPGAPTIYGFHIGDIVTRKRARHKGLGQIRMIRWSPDVDDFLFDVAWNPHVRETHKGAELRKVPERPHGRAS